VREKPRLSIERDFSVSSASSRKGRKKKAKRRSFPTPPFFLNRRQAGSHISFWYGKSFRDDLKRKGMEGWETYE